MTPAEVRDLMIRAEREHQPQRDERMRDGAWQRRCLCGLWLPRRASAYRNHQEHEAAKAISQALQETPTYLV